MAYGQLCAAITVVIYWSWFDGLSNDSIQGCDCFTTVRKLDERDVSAKVAFILLD